MLSYSLVLLLCLLISLPATANAFIFGRSAPSATPSELVGIWWKFEEYTGSQVDATDEYEFFRDGNFVVRYARTHLINV